MRKTAIPKTHQKTMLTHKFKAKKEEDKTMNHMNNFPNEAAVERMRTMYPSGCRVELVSMNDPYSKLNPGERGTVRFIDSIGTIFVDWNSGSGLGIAYGVDHIRKL